MPAPIENVTIRPEEWLLAASVSLISGAPGPRLQPSKPAKPDHWRKALDLARWHRLPPALYRVPFDDGAVPRPPAAIAAELAEAYRGNVGRGLLLRLDINRILAALVDSAIPAMVIKGVAVEDELYPHAGMRPAGDIDLLVSRPQLPHAEQVLKSLGFLAAGDEERREAYRLHHQHLAPYWHPQTKSTVELHWHVVRPDGPHRVDVSGLWDRARRASMSGTPYLKLSPEDQLLHLCLHFFSDRQWSRNGALFQLCDIALMLNGRGPSLDWVQFADRVLASAVGPSVYAALFAANMVTGSTLSDEVESRLRPDAFDESEATRFVLARVVGFTREIPPGPVETLATPGTLAKLGGLAQTLLPPSRRISGGSRSRHKGEGIADLLFRPVKVVTAVARLFRYLPHVREQVLVERWLGQQSGQAENAMRKPMQASAADRQSA